jgi:hypothetical protein
METNPIPRSKKYFRCICLNSVGSALSVGRTFSISPPPAHKAEYEAVLKCKVNTTKYTQSPNFKLLRRLRIDSLADLYNDPIHTRFL